MGEPRAIFISSGENVIQLPWIFRPIGVASAAATERQGNRESTVRFMLEGSAAMGAEPFNTLSEWHYEGREVTLLVEGAIPIGGCSLRECSLDMDTRRLYITVYTPERAQVVRHWFEA